VYLTSLIHRETLFDITQRWLCGRLEPDDGPLITQILICDGFVLSEALSSITQSLLRMIHDQSFQPKPIRYKGEVRDAICTNGRRSTPRAKELIQTYKTNPDFFYREAPVNGAVCLNEQGHLLGLYRIKRPKRIAEKANRYIANWIFKLVQNQAKKLAEERASQLGIPLGWLLTPDGEMLREFVRAEETIAGLFRNGAIPIDRSALTISDVGGIKIIEDNENLSRFEEKLAGHNRIKIVSRENHSGNYQARSLVLEIEWDKESACRKYIDTCAWKRYLDRGLSEDDLKKGLEPLLKNVAPTICIELILSTFPDMVESELGNSIHEERIIAQRDNKIYKGYIPMNVEFLIEYLFAVGFSPQTQVQELPVKLWGRYLPDTLSSAIRRLYRIPEYGFFS
jgi:hypothetical protein